MKFLIPLLVILLFLVFIGYRLRKQRNLLKKGEDYEKMLREAKVTRYQYTQALQITRDHLKEVESIKEKLTSLKAELIGYRNDLREQISNLRQQNKQSTGSELDKRTLAQMQSDLVQLLAHTNSRKKVALEIEASRNELRSKLKVQEKNENEVTDRWIIQKDQVINTYKELKDQLVLADPKKAFS